MIKNVVVLVVFITLLSSITLGFILCKKTVDKNFKETQKAIREVMV